MTPQPSSLPASTAYAQLRERMQLQHPLLPKRLAQVASFALANPDDIALGTAASVAAAAGVQPSTLVRLAQALGYSGFTELQLLFRERLRERSPNYADRLAALRAHAGAGARSGALLEVFADAAARSAHALCERIDLMALERAVCLLAGARTLFLAGHRRSFAVVAYLSYVLAKLGIEHRLLASPTGTDLETVARAGARDAMLAFSFTPYAPDTLAETAAAHRAGLPVVAVTDSPVSPLVEGAREWLEVVEADVEGFRNQSATFALAMTLAVAIAERRGITNGGAGPPARRRSLRKTVSRP
jgi:DNA-binding MurR/RpiR family transcriptional regulator